MKTEEIVINNNHELIEHFLNHTREETPVTSNMKSVIAQFIACTHNELNEIAINNGNCLTMEDLICAQIKVLSKCVRDLQSCLITTGTMQ